MKFYASTSRYAVYKLYGRVQTSACKYLAIYYKIHHCAQSKGLRLHFRKIQLPEFSSSLFKFIDSPVKCSSMRAKIFRGIMHLR